MLVRVVGERGSLTFMGTGASLMVEGAEEIIEGAAAAGGIGVDSFSGVMGLRGFKDPGMTKPEVAAGTGSGAGAGACGDTKGGAGVLVGACAAAGLETNTLRVGTVTGDGTRACSEMVGGGGAGVGIGEGSVLLLCALRFGLGSGDATRGTSVNVRRSAVAVGRSSSGIPGDGTM